MDGGSEISQGNEVLADSDRANAPDETAGGLPIGLREDLFGTFSKIIVVWLQENRTFSGIRGIINHIGINSPVLNL